MNQHHDDRELLTLAGLARALQALPTPEPPAALWQRIEARLDALPPAENAPAMAAAATIRRGQRAWVALRWLRRSPAPWALAACLAALFLWFGAIHETDTRAPAGPQAVAAADAVAADVDLAALQRISAGLEAELKARRTRSVHFDDELARSEAALALLLGQVDQALASVADPGQARALWMQRIALLAGMNEQAVDSLPLGQVDWVQVD